MERISWEPDQRTLTKKISWVEETKSPVNRPCVLDEWFSFLDERWKDKEGFFSIKSMVPSSLILGPLACHVKGRHMQVRPFTLWPHLTLDSLNYCWPLQEECNWIKFTDWYISSHGFSFLGNQPKNYFSSIRPQAFGWKMLHPENELDVKSELQCYITPNINIL